jgi:DNA-binding transcriptional MerR regulator
MAQINYLINEFAKVAGGSVRTLHHYDRLGLLKPRRTDAGYRLYSLRDLERLEQIVALTFLGLPLKRIKTLLDRNLLQLPSALRMQRAALEERRELLDRAINAIDDAEKTIRRGRPSDAQMLSAIFAALKLQDGPEFMEQYFSTEAWAKWKAHRRQLSREAKQHASQAWIDLYREAEASLGNDPAGEKAQGLARRWLALVDASGNGDREIKAGFTKAWLDRQHWPAKNRKRIAEFNLEKIAQFIGEIMACSMKEYYSEDSWARMMKRRQRSTPEERQRAWQAWIDLFRDIEASLGEDPAGETGQALAKRWITLAKNASEGDAAIKTGLQKAWQDREHWPDALREQLPPFNFDQISQFIKRTLAVRLRPRPNN